MSAQFLTGAELDRIEEEAGGEIIDPAAFEQSAPTAAPAPLPDLGSVLARANVAAAPATPAADGAPLARRLTRRPTRAEREREEREEILRRIDALLDEDEDEE